MVAIKDFQLSQLGKVVALCDHTETVLANIVVLDIQVLESFDASNR